MAHLGGCELWGDACCCQHLASAPTHNRHTQLWAKSSNSKCSTASLASAFSPAAVASQHIQRESLFTSSDAATCVQEAAVEVQDTINHVLLLTCSLADTAAAARPVAELNTAGTLLNPANTAAAPVVIPLPSSLSSLSSD
jgi:hypothetical protein